MQRQDPMSRLCSKKSRRGVAAVEFAVIAPLFVAITMGAVQIGIAVSAAQTLCASLREAGRLATMDYTSRLQSGQTANQKVIQDIRNMLTAERISGNQATITITSAEGSNAGTTFDLSDPANDLALFKIKAVVPYSAICSTTFFSIGSNTISASIVYRKGKTTLVH